jgi:hypothetical protein
MQHSSLPAYVVLDLQHGMLSISINLPQAMVALVGIGGLCWSVCVVQWRGKQQEYTVTMCHAVPTPCRSAAVP